MFEEIKNNEELKKGFFENAMDYLSTFFKKSEEKSIVVNKQYSDCILVNEHGEILVLLRSNTDDFHPGVWALPGGKIENNETTIDAAARELYEETNIKIDVADLSSFKVVQKENCTINYFIGSVLSHDLKIILENEEHQGFEWIKPEAIVEKTFILDLADFLKDSFHIYDAIQIKDDQHYPIVELPLMKSERIYSLEQDIVDMFNKGEIEEEQYFSYLEKVKLLKNNFEDDIVFKKGNTGEELSLRIKKGNDSSEMMRDQFDNYINTSFFYKENLYDFEGMRIPIPTDQVQQVLASNPSIYKWEEKFANDAESSQPIMDGLPRKDFERVLPIIEEYDEMYGDIEEDLKDRYNSTQNDYSQQINDIKKIIKDYSEGSFNSDELLDLIEFIEERVSDNIDPLLELTVDGKKRQIYVSELKDYVRDLEDQYEPTAVNLGVTSFEIVNLNNYDDNDFKINFFDNQDPFIIQTIHSKVKQKLANKKEDLVDLTKAWDGGDISDEQYFDLVKAKRYELVKVVRDGKTFYQNRLIGSDQLEELPVNESFADEKTGLEVTRYSDKSILVSGNTYKNIDLLRNIKSDIGYGTWNKSLNGWIFPFFAKDKIFAALAEKMDISTYDETIEKENTIALKNALDINAPIVVDGVETKSVGIQAEDGEVSYDMAEKSFDKPSEKEEVKKRGRKSVAVGTISDDGKRVKTVDGWEYIKTKRTEKEVGIPEATEEKAEEIINNVDESTRFKAGKELFGKAEDEPSIKEEIEAEVSKKQTRAEIINITTRSGEEVQALNYSFVKPIDVQLVDPDKTLEERPYWCPAINEKMFYRYKDDGFAFDYVKLEDDKILLALNGFEKKDFKGDISTLRTINTELKADMEANLIPYYMRRSIGTTSTPEGLHFFTINGKRYEYANKEDMKNDTEALNNNQEANYAVVSVDQLVAIQDFYVKKRKADINANKEFDTARYLESFKKRFLANPDFYDKYYAFSYEKRLSDKQRKQYTKEEWEALSLDEKFAEIPNMKHPVISLGKATRISVLDDHTMMMSNFDMFKKFVDKSYLTPKDKGQRGYDYSDAAAVEYKEVRDLLKWKRLDLQIQREENLNSYTKGLETSYGNSNTIDDLLESHGVKIKTQNGKKMSDGQKIQIEESLTEVYNSFGDRSSMAKKFGLKISHSGEKLMFARQALGLYVPSMNAIGVSNNQEHDKFGFTLAHEYSHFIDNYLGKQTDRHYASDDHTSIAGKIAYRFRDIMNKGKFTDTDYANRTCECFARALEQYHAMKIEGDDAIKSKKNNKPYHEEEGHVSKTQFNEIIKPMIEQLFSEKDHLLKSAHDELMKGKDTFTSGLTDFNSVSSGLKMAKKDLINWAKNTPLQNLESFIKQAEDPELRKIAHEEMARREKEEHVQEKIKKSENELIKGSSFKELCENEDFWQFCIDKNKEDRDSGEIYDLSDPEKSRLISLWEKEKDSYKNPYANINKSDMIVEVANSSDNTEVVADEPVKAEVDIRKGCLMFYPKINKDKWISSVSKMIPSDICVDDGYETNPHCTVLFGFDDDALDISKLTNILDAYCFDKTPELVLENISLFENANDVVKIGVLDTNGFLTNLNQLLKQSFSYQNSYAEYKPHFTLSYVQQGLGQAFLNRTVDPIEFGILNINEGQFVYSNHNYTKTIIKSFGNYDNKILKSEEEEKLAIV